MPDRPDPTTLPISAFAAVAGLSEAALRDLIRRGLLPKAVTGRLPIVEGVRAIVAQTKAEAQSGSLAAAQEQAKAARADANEMALEIARRDLVSDEDANAAVDHVVASIINSVASIPARVTRDVPDRRRVEAALRTAQAAISDDLENAAGRADYE